MFSVAKRHLALCLMFTFFSLSGCVGTGDPSPGGNGPDLGAGEASYAALCASCHDDGSSLGTKPDFGAVDNIDIVGTNGLFKCEYTDCEGTSTLSAYIERSMPWSTPLRCDAECANNIAAYISANFETRVVAPIDSDRDGVADIEDGCPREFGPAGNDGCPIPSSSPDPDPGDAVNGMVIYERQCSSCHGENGAGGVVSRSLIRDECSVCGDFGDLVNTIESTMPVPGACTGVCAIDVATYITTTFTDAIVATDCDRVPVSPGVSPLRRLNKREYTNTVRNLFGVTSDLIRDFPVEQATEFDNDVGVLGVSQTHVEAFASVAQKVAKAFVESLTPTTSGTVNRIINCANLGDRCVENFINGEGALRIYRRPLKQAEKNALLSIYTSGKRIDFKAGMQLVLEAMLQSPAFLYRAEFGGGANVVPGIKKLNSWEVATRLSYMFWATTPDNALLNLAREDKLQDPVIVRQQAERLLAGGRAKAVIRSFFRSWFKASEVRAISRDSILFEGFTDRTPELYLQQLDRFVDYVMWQTNSSWDEFLAADYTFVNDSLAQLYDEDLPGSNEFMKVSHPGRNFGLLSLGAFLASKSHEIETAPVLRGAFIAQNIMCVHIDPPPADSDLLIEPPAPDPNATTRERWSAATSGRECDGCHRTLNPAGFVFENFDPVGRWRTSDAGKPIDTLIHLPGTDIGGMYSDPADFVNAMTQSDQIAACAVSKWAQYSYGRLIQAEIGQVDECSMRKVEARFTANNKSVKRLLVELTQTDAFLYKRR